MDNNRKNTFFIIFASIAFIILLIIFYILTNAQRENLPANKITGSNVNQGKNIDKLINGASTEAEKIDNLKADNTAALQEAEKSSLSQVRPIDSSDHVLGSLNAPVKIITYGDFDCPFCPDFNDILKKISSEYKDKVVIAFRNFPQRQHANAWTAANAAECASAQGKFWEMHDRLFKLKKEDKLNDSQYASTAKELKLDQAKFLECLSKSQFNDKILAQYTEAKTFGIIGTPGTFVNGEVYPGAVPYDDFTDSSGLKREGMKGIIERMLK